MDEHISRETAIKSTWMILDGMGYPRSENRSLERTVEAVFKSAPAADVVPVVRCRECYFRALDGADVPVCTGAMAYSHTPDDWFCAAGKPKEGEQDE